MTHSVAVLLVLALFASAFATPTDYGKATADQGSIGVGVVSGGDFGGGAFSIGHGGDSVGRGDGGHGGNHGGTTYGGQGGDSGHVSYGS